MIIIHLAGKDSQTSHSQVFTTEPKTFSGSTKMTLKKRDQKVNTDFVFCSGTFIVHWSNLHFPDYCWLQKTGGGDGTKIPDIMLFSMVAVSRNFLKFFSIIVLKSHFFMLIIQNKRKTPVSSRQLWHIQTNKS